MNLGFRGEVVDFYQRYRRGYPPAVITRIVEKFALTGNDIAVDLGCGPGQLTLPLAQRVRAVIGIDPSSDMLSRAPDAPNVTWMIGADTDIPKLTRLLGERTVGAVTIGQALHWMRYDTLFPALIPLLRKGGGVAVVTNGTPLWLQDSAWSRALRAFVEDWLGEKTVLTCGSDAASQQRYRSSLHTAGFATQDTHVDYTDELRIDQIAGSIFSAVPVEKLPTPSQRPAFVARLQTALEPCRPFVEHVRITILTGQVT